MIRWTSMVFLTAVFLGVYVDKGHSIHCFLCSSLQTEDCVKPNSNHLQLTKCDQTALAKTKNFAKNITYQYEPIFDIHLSDQRIDLDCLKMVTKVSTTEVIVRGCQLAEQSNMDICKRVKEVDTDQIKVKSCHRCSIDKCNVASTNIVKLVVFIPVALVAFLVL